VFVVQLSDVLQFVWGKSIGKRRIAPSISLHAVSPTGEKARRIPPAAATWTILTPTR
jgi:hypothetical protein